MPGYESERQSDCRGNVRPAPPFERFMTTKTEETLELAETTPSKEIVKQEKVPVLADSFGVQLRSLDEMYRFALAVSRSGLAPKQFQTPEAIMIAMQHGAEIGLAPMQSLQSIAVINGRPCVWGDAALGLVSAHPDFVDIIETIEGDGDSRKATCIVKRKGRTDTVRTFTVADAKKAKLWGKQGPWTDYPDRMLQMRARSFVIRDAFADALKGIGIREEVQDYSTAKPVQGRVIENNEVELPE